MSGEILTKGEVSGTPLTKQRTNIMAKYKVMYNEEGKRLKKDGTLAKRPGRKPDPAKVKRPPMYYKGVERPQVWVVGPNKELHDKYHPWQMAKAQANFRKEEWDLSFKEYCDLWEGHWQNRGRHPHNVCMTRQDDEGPWDAKNTYIITRKEHFQIQAQKRNYSGSKRGPDRAPRTVPRMTCPYCGMESSVSMIKAWHLDKCKQKPTGDENA